MSVFERKYFARNIHVGIWIIVTAIPTIIFWNQSALGLDVQIDLDIQNDCPDCLIEPMLLIPFIENAFKHGIGMVKERYIKASLTARKEALEFKISNNYIDSPFSKDQSAGIGSTM